MKLHGYYRSSASFRVRIALNLKGVTWESVPHHLRRDEQRAPDYLRLNKQGFVPALEHEGRVLAQSMAIIEYLDEIMPAPALLPGNALDRAHARALAQLVGCDIHPVNNLRVLRYLRQHFRAGDAAVASWYNHWIAEGFAAMEAILAAESRTGVFCCGGQPGLADICLVPQVVNAGNYRLDMSPYPTIRRIYEACLEVPAFADALPARQGDAE